MLETILNAGLEFWNVLRDMSPYLLLGFLVAGLLSVLIRPETVERHLGGKGILPVLKASIFGIPLPLCSCGVIPVSASLRRHGASRGATASFLLSTPQTGVDSILVTFSLLGPVFAVFRPLAALVSGLLGGSFVSLLTSGEKSQGPELKCQDECCSGEQKSGKISRILHNGFVTLPRDIGKALIIGLLIAAAISAIVPNDFFAGIMGHGIAAMFVMMLVAIPIYVCATASVPVAAALIAAGISPGAALVFLMTGPATNAATIATIWKIMGRRTALIYLGAVALTALGAGVLLDYLFTVSGTSSAPSMPLMIPGFVKTGSAVVLLVILGVAMFSSSHKHSDSPSAAETSETVTFKVKGMSCSHCVESVKRALGERAGVQSVEVDLKTGQATVGGEDMDVSELRHAVEELGYKTE